MKYGQFQENAIKNRKHFLKKRQLSERTMQIGKLILWGSAVVLFACIGFGVVYEVLPAHNATIALQATAQSVKSFSDTGAREVQVNGDEAHRVLLETGLTARQARLASTSQRAFWDTEVPKLATKSEEILADTDTAVKAAGKTAGGLGESGKQVADSVTSTSNALNLNLGKAGDAFQAAGVTMAAAGKVIGDPSIPTTLLDIRSTVHSIAGMAEHGNHIMGNLDQKVDTTLHPGFWGQVKSFGLLGIDLAKDAVETNYYWQSAAPTVVVQGARTVARNISAHHQAKKLAKTGGR